MLGNPSGRTSHVFNCRESSEARAQLDVLAAKKSQFSTLWQGVVWLLIRNPYNAGNLLPGWTDIFLLKTIDFLAIGMPTLFVYYKIIDVTARVIEVIRVNDGTP
jgi:hypothetical protein